MEIEIAVASLPESPLVSAVLTETIHWLAERGDTLWPLEEVTPASLEIDIRDRRFHLVRKAREVAAVFRLDAQDFRFWPGETHENALYLHRLAVRRKFAGRGLSSRIFNFARQQAKAQGVQFLRTNCESHRYKLRDLYENEGFTLHSEAKIGSWHLARYEFPLSPLRLNGSGL